jgi:16S rRNA (cytosine1402-N4)-methyltransferase
MEETTSQHKAVLVREVVNYLNPQPGKTYLDVTFGGGGHTRAILEAEPNCNVIALDWDSRALEVNGAALQEQFPGRLRLIWGNFALLYKILKNEDIDAVDGVLADFGTSQDQIFNAPGFSLYRDTPLDMRMSPSHQKVTAAEIVNKGSEEKLRQLFWQLADERYAKQIVVAIALARKTKEIKTTLQLAEIVASAVPAVSRTIHPATKVFQALRIYINHELENIQAFLPAAVRAITPPGRLVVISFHSLEDRLVKNYFKQSQIDGLGTVLTSEPVVASKDELVANSSARSAKLRAFEIISK